MVAWLYALGLLILGFVLILLEIFVIPGVNIFGILGFLTVCAGVAYSYVSLGLWPAAGVAAVGVVGTGVLLGILFRAKAWRRLVLSSATSRELGYDSAPPDSGRLLGQRGEALTVLRPAGRARIDGRIVDVVSEGGFIASGAVVEVIHVAGSKVVVQLAEEGAASAHEV